MLKYEKHTGIYKKFWIGCAKLAYITPLWISLVTNKYTIGIKSADEIIKELSK